MKKFHFSFFYLILLGVAILAFGCSEKSSSEVNEVDALYDEVIEIHDEVMPKMSEIVSLRKTAKDQLNAELAGGAPDSLEVAFLEQRIASLEAADNAMMNWMRNFQANMDDMTELEQIEYLKSERDKIAAVKEQMLSAIEEAKQK